MATFYDLKVGVKMFAGFLFQIDWDEDQLRFPWAKSFDFRLLLMIRFQMRNLKTVCKRVKLI